MPENRCNCNIFSNDITLELDLRGKGLKSAVIDNLKNNGSIKQATLICYSRTKLTPKRNEIQLEAVVTIKQGENQLNVLPIFFYYVHRHWIHGFL